MKASRKQAMDKLDKDVVQLKQTMLQVASSEQDHSQLNMTGQGMQQRSSQPKKGSVVQERKKADLHSFCFSLSLCRIRGSALPLSVTSRFN